MKLIQKIACALALVIALATSPIAVESAEAQRSSRVSNASQSLKELCINLDAIQRLINIFGDLRGFLDGLRGILASAFQPPNINPNCLDGLIPAIPGFDINGLANCLRNSIQVNPNVQFSCNFTGQLVTFNDPRACLSFQPPNLNFPNLEDLANQCVQAGSFDPESILSQIQGLLEGLLDPVLNFRIPLGLPTLLPRLEGVCRDFGYIGGSRRAKIKIVNR